MPAKKPAEEIFVNPMDSSGSDDDEENDGSGGDSAAPSKSPAASTPSTPRAEDLAAAEVGTDIKKVEIVDEEAQTEIDTMRYMVCSKANVRQGSGMDTEALGMLKKGEVIEVTHTKEVDGKIRLRFKLGWVSAFSADGYTTLMAENCPNKCYKALDDCVIRMDFDKTSDKAANPKLPKNKVIEVIESKELDDGSGVIRMQFQKGWTSDRTSAGKKLLKEVRFKHMYRCLDKARLREGFEKDSAEAGFLKKHELVESLEGKLNEDGYMRIRTPKGWVSCFAADGTMLLLDMNAKAPPKAKKPAKDGTKTSRRHSMMGAVGGAVGAVGGAAGGLVRRGSVEDTSGAAGMEMALAEDSAEEEDEDGGYGRRPSLAPPPEVVVKQLGQFLKKFKHPEHASSEAKAKLDEACKLMQAQVDAAQAQLK